MNTIRAILALTALAALSPGGELVLPSRVLDRDRVVTATYKLGPQVSGTGTLSLRWTDSLGRVVEDRKITVQLTDEDRFTFPLDVRRAVAMDNRLDAHFSISGRNLKGEDKREEDVSVTFTARPPQARWSDYEIVMWQQYPEKLLPELAKLGITAGQYSGRTESLPQGFIRQNMRWYSENIATDFYAEYHRYRRDRIQNWSFLQAKEQYRKDPSIKEAFKRHPSLWDPVWRADVRERLMAAVKRNAPYRPLFYSLADESGIADLAAFWDFDFSDQSLVPMRRWLRERYASLEALNREWETSFDTWDAVTPPTTHEAMQRKGDNFAAWADFKEWMDISFADALLMGRKAVEEVDPEAYVNIGGGQRPGWGGYDYARITKALTAIEPYDIGNNVEIIRSLNPAMAMMSTGFARSPWEQQRVWRELFHGHRGLIIWDEKREYVSPDGRAGERGKDAAKYYNEIRNGAGALIINSTPVNEPIAIHYSQASMRTEWMLARRPEGDAWINRNARVERTDDEFLRLRESWCQLIEDQGMQYKFVSYDQLENGELLRGGHRVFVLPRSSSLSAAEVSAIRTFVSQGGTVIADGEPGTFNEHSRRLPTPALQDLFPAGSDPISAQRFGSGKAVRIRVNTIPYHMDRLLSKEGATHKLIGDLLRQDVQPLIRVTDKAGNAVVGVEVHAFRNGGATVLTLLSNPLQRVDELGPPDFRSNKRFETPISVSVTLPAEQHLYDVRLRKALGSRKSIELTVTPYEPVILAMASSPFPRLQVVAPPTAMRGGDIEVGFSAHGTPAATHVVHVDVINPAGHSVRAYSANVLASGGTAVHRIPLAVNDPAGEWTIRVHDLLSGTETTAKVQVN
jgi:hypothetical protein